jgi:predicted O-methyltransferase YrrM
MAREEREAAATRDQFRSSGPECTSDRKRVMTTATEWTAEAWQRLWINRGIEPEAVPGSAMMEIHGVRGFLLQGDLEYLWGMGRSLARGGRHIEIGSGLGLTSILVANSLLAHMNFDARIVCVDTWDRALTDVPPAELRPDSPYEAFLRNVREAEVKHFVQTLRGNPARMAVHFEDGSLESIWVDHEHTCESMRAVLDAWLPKLRRGGRIAGHDAVPGDGVLQAVEQVAAEEGLRLNVLPPPTGHYIWELQGR